VASEQVEEVESAAKVAIRAALGTSWQQEHHGSFWRRQPIPLCPREQAGGADTCRNAARQVVCAMG